jgi:hypothetical protein
LKLQPSNSKTKYVVQDAASQLAQATLLAKTIRELSLNSSAKVEKAVLEKLFNDPASISDLIRKLGLSDALLKSLQKTSPSRDLGNIQYKFDPQLSHMVFPKIQNPGNYDMSEVSIDLTNQKPQIADLNLRPPHSDIRDDLNIVQLFSPSKDDLNYTIDDLSSVLNGSENYEKVYAVSSLFVSNDLGLKQSHKYNQSEAIFMAASCVVFICLIWIFF